MSDHVTGCGETLENDTPVRRIESLLRSIATNTAAMRRAFDAVQELEEVLAEARRRQDEVLARLDAFDREYVAVVKSHARHTTFMRKLREVKAVVRRGFDGSGGESREDEEGMSLGSLLNRIGVLRREIAETPLMQSGEQFVEPVSRELEGLLPLYRELHAILGSPLPAAAEPAAVGTVADNDAWVALLLRLRKADAGRKLTLVAAAMRTAAGDMARVARQAEKMEIRAADGSSSANERDVARRKSFAVRKSVEAIRRRMVMLAASFYSRRERTLAAVADATRDVVAALNAKGVTRETIMDVKAFRNRHPVARHADDILGLDAALDSGKGTNATLGNLMKFYRDNAQRRISNG